MECSNGKYRLSTKNTIYSAQEKYIRWRAVFPGHASHVIDVQNRKDEGEGKKREAAKETHEPPPRMSPNLRPIVFGLKVRTRGFPYYLLALWVVKVEPSLSWPVADPSLHMRQNSQVPSQKS